jgi:mono/diheme cytochrome c family protein
VLAISFPLMVLISACAVQPTPDVIEIQETTVPAVPTPDAVRVGEGEKLYDRYCASCHGVDLEGQPSWQQPLEDGSLLAPPHDSSGHTWHHPDELLVDIITNGGDPTFGSTMPAFKDQLEEGEVLAILEFIKTSWGKDELELQWWISSR